MRVALAALAILVVGFSADRASADPYRWCAQYGGLVGGPTNCYFMTLRQCHAAISGVGGFCRPNPFYTGGEPRRRGRRG